jgi:uncharacterized protein (TIGR03435 family)
VKALAAAICVLTAGVLRAQTLPSFEVASVRVSDPDDRGRCAQFLPGGRFLAQGCQITFMIQLLYGVHRFQVVNAPAWTHGGFDTFYTIQAKAGEATSNEQLRLMAQNLLADRFHLRYHRETREMDVYAMVVGKNGLEMQSAKDNGQPRGSGGLMSAGPGVMREVNGNMDNVAMALSEQAGRPVIDKTGLSDAVDFVLEWSPEEGADTTRPSIFTAVQEQLGLKLEPRRMPVEVLVIDHVERPTEN